MNSRTLAVALFLSLPLVSLPHVATAQPAADDSLVKEARARFKEGVDLYDKGQYDAARVKFLQAYALRRHPAILLNMGLSCLKSGHPAEAARYLSQFQREATSATPQEHSDADKGITEARTKDARLDVSAPTGTEISVDDTVIGNAPLSDSVDVDPGQHTIKAKASDGTVDSRSVNTSVGQRLPVKSGPGSSAVVAPIPPPVATTNPEVPPPDQTTPPPPPTPKDTQPETPSKKTNLLAPPKTMFPVYIAGGVAGAGVVTAILFGVFRSQAVSSMNDATATIVNGGGGPGICASTATADRNKYGAACSALQQDIDHANTDTTVANVGIGVAIVGVLGGAAWYLFSPKQDDAAADSSAPAPSAPPAPAAARIDVVAPWMGWGSGGLSVKGSF